MDPLIVVAEKSVYDEFAPKTRKETVYRVAV